MLVFFNTLHAFFRKFEPLLHWSQIKAYFGEHDSIFYYCLTWLHITSSKAYLSWEDCTAGGQVSKQHSRELSKTVKQLEVSRKKENCTNVNKNCCLNIYQTASIRCYIQDLGSHVTQNMFILFFIKSNFVLNNLIDLPLSPNSPVSLVIEMFNNFLHFDWTAFLMMKTMIIIIMCS